MKSASSVICRAVALLLFSCASFCVYAQLSCTHVVRSGETLSTIATQYGVSEKDIIRANSILANFLMPGQELEIPLATGNHSRCSSFDFNFARDIELSARVSAGISSFFCNGANPMVRPSFGVDGVFTKNFYGDLWLEGILGFANKGSASAPLYYVRIGLVPAEYRWDSPVGTIAASAGVMFGIPLNSVSTSLYNFDSKFDVGARVYAGYSFGQHSVGVSFEPSFTEVCSSKLSLRNYGVYLSYAYTVFSR